MASIALVLMAFSVCAASEEPNRKGDAGEKRAEISKLFAVMDLKPYPASAKKALCMNFREDFKRQQSISYIQPTVLAQTKDDSKLSRAFAGCPNFAFNKNYAFKISTTGFFTLLSGPPWAEPDYYEDTVYGTTGFRLYNVDFNDDPSDGNEVIYYEEGLSGLRQYHGGIFKLIDLKNCNIQASILVQDLIRDETLLFSALGVLRYRGQTYVYDFYASNSPKLVPPWGKLVLYAYQSERTYGGRQQVHFHPVCSFGA